MKEIHEIIAENLKKYRKNEGLTLDKVATMTGVSKTMLGQIERSDSIPSISTIWKIANGLKLSFTSLIEEQTEEIEVIKKSELHEITMDNNRYKIYPCFSFEPNKQFEIYIIEIEPGGFLESERHTNGATEYLTVYEGELELIVNSHTYHLEKNDSIKFRANCQHSYRNNGKDTNKINMTIHYASL